MQGPLKEGAPELRIPESEASVQVLRSTCTLRSCGVLAEEPDASYRNRDVQ